MVLNRTKLQRGLPKMMYCDNRSEFSSQAMDLWAYQNGVRIAFPRPGKQTDNAFTDSRKLALELVQKKQKPISLILEQ
jgi:putative transposase